MTPVRWKRTLCAAHQVRKISLRVDSSPISPDSARREAAVPGRHALLAMIPGVAVLAVRWCWRAASPRALRRTS